MSCSALLYLLVNKNFILHAVAIEGFCVRWPLKVARLEVAKAWPLGARGCSLLGLCPLIELQWGRRSPPLTSQPADQELFQLTCNYSEGMRQSSVHQYWSKVCDTNALVDSSSWSLNRMWKCWQGLNCRPGMTKPMICWSLFVRPFISTAPLRDTLVTIPSVHLKRMHRGRRSLENSQVSRQWRRCESTKKVFHISGAASGLRQGLGRSNGRSARS